MSFLPRNGVSGDLFVRLLLYIVVTSNIFLLSWVFLYPRLYFMLSHWGASEREILLSPGPRDNPNLENRRKIYQLMYFIKDNTEERAIVYFINPHFSPSEAYKILLPREVKFIESDEVKSFLPRVQGRSVQNSYLVFRKEDLPDMVQRREVVWYEKEWGVCKLW